jgi:F0F1-type ATP synthase membrane subunit c/vacuolar-type H+-ATPase subunit K
MAALIDFGAGLGAGLIVAGGFSARCRRSRMAGPVMNALSDLAYNLIR